MVRYLRVLGPAAMLLVAVCAVLTGLVVGGGAAPIPVQDPGAVVRWGLPIVTLLVDIAAAGTLGAIVLAVWVMSPQTRAYQLVLDIAAASSAVLTIAAATTGILIFLSVTGMPLSASQQFGAQLAQFITQIPLGLAWLTTTLVAAAVTVLCFAIRNQTAVAFIAALAVVALIPIAQQGHAAGTAGHNAAVTALGLHIVGAAVWLGGLLTIMLLSGRYTSSGRAILTARYSSIALICFITVTVSGYASAALRIGTWESLATPYGLLVLVKLIALVALGGFGVIQRRLFISRMTRGRRNAFWYFTVVELLVMGLAVGTAVALARTPTPVSQTVPNASLRTPAEILTGEPLPPWPDLWRYFTEWRPDLIWLLLCGFGLFFYLAGVWRLRRRGDRWPIYRTVLWVCGLLLLGYVTSGGVNRYQESLFSAHMLGHMTLTMAVPVLLVPGAPVSLAMRAIRPRKDGSRGGREWILLAVHSRAAGVLANPIIAAVLFAASLWIFYYTPLFRWSMVDHIGHEWMIAHFLITGYLFVQSLIGVDPVPHRLAYPFRLVLLLGTMAFHAFFGLAIMSGTGLLLADWYGAMGWGTSAIADQQLGGGIAWSVGEIPTVALAITVALQWARSDEKESRRFDRQADRTGDAELEAYNARLAELARSGVGDDGR